ncbi:diaminopimelate decarboxylase, partial [uncultured Oscillibacter sp.]
MKTPFVTKDRLESIAAQYPTPFHIYDEKGIRENAQRLKAAFAWNPGFREYFAVKATPTPAILKILHEEGCGCDCSSLAELALAERCGVTGEAGIMFSSNNTTEEEFQAACRLGGVVNLDDITLIDTLTKAVGKVPEKICCRYNPGGVFTLGESRDGVQVMDTPGDAKYGMTRPQLAEAFRRLRELGAKEFGIHAFLASNTLSNDYYPALARILFQLAAELQAETGCRVTFINLSGGVGVPYRPEEPENDIAVIGEGVRRAYEEILVPAGMDGVALYTELGRYMLAPYGHLVTRAIHEKHIYKEYIGVDACACNLMRPAMYGAYHHITVMGKENAPCDHKYDVAGSLCENNDKFAV